MAHLSRLPVDAWDHQLREMTGADTAMPLTLGSLPVIAHNPIIATGFVSFFAALKRGRKLPARLLELVRLKIASHNQCRTCLAIRYEDALEDGLTEHLVCSLEEPSDAGDLTDAERIAVEFGDRLASRHLSIDGEMYDRLREHFSEAEIVELGVYAATCVGFGRFSATLDLVEDIPDAFRSPKGSKVSPGSGTPVIVRR